MAADSGRRRATGVWGLVLLPLLATGARAQQGDLEFALRGRPIAPQCLQPLTRGGAEAPPATTIVELESCAAMTASPPAWEAASDGRRSFRRTTDGHDGGYFGYRYRGRTSDGLAVLDTWDSDGGSGTYTEVLLLRQEESRLVLVRSIPGGDRCVAGISNVAVDGFDVTLDFHIGAADLLGLADELATARSEDTPELDLGAGPPNDCEGAARYRYAPAISGARQLLGIDYRPSQRSLHAESSEARCLRQAFGDADTFLDRPRLRRAAEELRACLAAAAAD